MAETNAEKAACDFCRVGRHDECEQAWEDDDTVRTRLVLVLRR